MIRFTTQENKKLPLFALKLKLKFLNKQIDELVDYNFGYCPNDKYFDELLEESKLIETFIRSK
jgi:hypothetical protein